MHEVFVDKNGLKKTDWTIIENYQSFGLPVLYLSGSVLGISKDDSVTLDYIYKDRAGSCALTWQGSSALTLPKKNYTIKFDNAFEVVSGWGAQKKYVLKANFVDSSHARNIVCAKIWGQIVKSRTPANARLNALPNGGAVDGFPIIVSLNGKFHGLYTWNIPKDAWMFGMDGTGQQAIVCAELNDNGAVAFKGLALLDETDFSLEYSSDDQSAWVVESLNRLLGAVKDSDGSNITKGITPYLDWESAIDYYIHATLTSNYDGIWRNYLLATYDGVKWFFTGYDMDVVLGLRAMGRYFYPANHSAVSFKTVAGMHKVFELIWKYMRPQLRARYKELRESVLSVENVANLFVDFTADIPLPVYVDDVRRWHTIPSSGANNIAQIITNYDLRCRNADKWIENTDGEHETPESGYINLVETSIDADGSIYNAIGYKENYRLSSSGGESETAGACVTGYIPFKYGDVIRAVGSTAEVTKSGMYFGFYNSSFEKTTVEYLSSIAVDPYGSYVQRDDGLYESTFDSGSLTSGNLYDKLTQSAYVRVSLNPCKGSDMIVTINEEIT